MPDSEADLPSLAGPGDALTGGRPGCCEDPGPPWAGASFLQGMRSVRRSEALKWRRRIVSPQPAAWPASQWSASLCSGWEILRPYCLQRHLEGSQGRQTQGVWTGQAPNWAKVGPVGEGEQQEVLAQPAGCPALPWRWPAPPALLTHTPSHVGHGSPGSLVGAGGGACVQTWLPPTLGPFPAYTSGFGTAGSAHGWSRS